MFVVAIANARFGAALVTLILAGAMLGFLYFNFHPATIFLGDSGSLFVASCWRHRCAERAEVPHRDRGGDPGRILGLPVLDTLIARVPALPAAPADLRADRGHIHHRLLGRGYSPRGVVLALYGVCAILALGGMLLVNNAARGALVLVTIGIGVGSWSSGSGSTSSRRSDGCCGAVCGSGTRSSVACGTRGDARGWYPR